MTEQTRVPELVPRPVLRAMAGMCLTTLALVTWAVLTDRPLSATPDPGILSSERSIILVADGVSGAVTVLSPLGTMVARLDAEEGGFVAGVARVLHRERTARGIDPAAPVTLRRSTDGRLTLTDPYTGWRTDLMGFGADNSAAFAALLNAS